ncbi:MAG: alpha/beta hydrolase [Candidatus Saccharimonadales bacterium]|jgi:pimeloyl-ACP methyl ester carboxylesterase
MQMVVEKLLTHFERIGSGKSIVLLHGWGDQAVSFVSLSSKLAKHYDVIIPDLPGFGGTEMPTEAWDLTNYATFISQFLQKLGVINVYAYIGHSNGGAIAIKGLSDGCLSANKLILLSSSGIRDDNKRISIVKTVTKTGKLLTSPLPNSMQMKLRQKLYRTVGSDMLVAEHMSSTFKKIITDDVQADAKQLDLPTLILYGSNDKITPKVYGQRFHDLIKNSSLKIIPSASHFIHHDQLETILKLIEDFLA